MDTQLAEDPVFKIRSSFEPDGDTLIVDTWIDPGGGVTPHVHPAMEERFETIEGTAQFLSGRKWHETPGGRGRGRAGRHPPRVSQPQRRGGPHPLPRHPADDACRSSSPTPRR